MMLFHVFLYEASRTGSATVRQQNVKAMLRQKVLAVVFEPIIESNYEMLISIIFM